MRIWLPQPLPKKPQNKDFCKPAVRDSALENQWFMTKAGFRGVVLQNRIISFEYF